MPFLGGDEPAVPMGQQSASVVEQGKNLAKNAGKFATETVWQYKSFRVAVAVLVILLLVLVFWLSVSYARQQDATLRLTGTKTLGERIESDWKAWWMGLKTLWDQPMGELKAPAGAQTYQVRKNPEQFKTFSQASAFPGSKQPVGKELFAEGMCGSCNIQRPSAGYPGNFALQQKLTPMVEGYQGQQVWNPESRTESFGNNQNGDAAYPSDNNIYQSGSMGLTATTITGVYANSAGSPAASLGVSFA